MCLGHIGFKQLGVLSNRSYVCINDTPSHTGCCSLELCPAWRWPWALCLAAGGRGGRGLLWWERLMTGMVALQCCRVAVSGDRLPPVLSTCGLFILHSLTQAHSRLSRFAEINWARYSMVSIFQTSPLSCGCPSPVLKLGQTTITWDNLLQVT